MTNHWKVQHQKALTFAFDTRVGFTGFEGLPLGHPDAKGAPVAMEKAIVQVLSSLRLFALAHQTLYGSPIGDDYVLGDYWEDMAKALIGMLNGECGRLDAGAIDTAVRAMAKEFSADLE